MQGKLINKVLYWAGSVLGRSFVVYSENLKAKTFNFIENFPEIFIKLYILICATLFFIVLGGIGMLLIPIGTVIMISSPNGNEALWLLLIGIFYCVISFLFVMGSGLILYLRKRKNSNKMLRKMH